MTTQTNKQGGFAIGLILLAVVLIAAIVAAIAVSTQDSGSSGDREQARINASTVVQQGIALQNAFTRANVLGILSAANLPDGNAQLCDNNNIGATSSLQTIIGDSGTINRCPDASQVTNGGVWRIARDGNAYWIYLTNVPSGANQVCEQINSVLWRINELGDTFSPAAPDEVDIGGTARTEGCDANGVYFRRVVN